MKGPLKVVFVYAILIISNQVFSQTKAVSGEFMVFNRYPVKNLKVEAKKSKASVLTDSLGQFQIVCKNKDVIKIETDIFRPVSIRVGKSQNSVGKKNLIFIDNPRNRELATGYGYIKESDLTYAMSHLEYENNDFCNYNDIYDLFTGRFAGVTVQSVGGRRGVYIRGISSLNLSSEALYVVDNIVMESIDHILPCEVMSIDILKDGGASLYGSRGANGVVIIQLKR